MNSSDVETTAGGTAVQDRPSAPDPLLEKARAVAREIARSRDNRTVTIDDVQERLEAVDGVTPQMLGRRASAVFTGGGWKEVRRVRSRRPARRGGYIREWQLQEGIAG